LGKVKGSVTYKNQPVTAGTIILEAPGKRSASGKIVNGQITDVTTYEPNDGAPLGQSRIAVFATEESGSSSQASVAKDPGTPVNLGKGYMGAGAKSLIPTRYSDPATSGLTWEIKTGENALAIELKD
jgi:hypothetical protein